MQPTDTRENLLPTRPVRGAAVPKAANDDRYGNSGLNPTSLDVTRPAANDALFSTAAPPHTHTESTLAPTSEFARYLLTAWGTRYFARGVFGLAFNDPVKRGEGVRKRVLDWLGTAGDRFAESGWGRGHARAVGYNAALGTGSLSLTSMYSITVKKDIKNIFSEAVGAELGRPANAVSFDDLSHSNNRIVQKTLDNYWRRLGLRLFVDALFFPAALLKHEGAGDVVLGLKAIQLFVETWKRKTTMFEDLVTFVNNKINPRNGLGQPIAPGEVFDLYQHYAQEFTPDRAFTNVIERPTGEEILWARGEPIFRRITELMNHTYAYKHPAIINPQTGDAVQQANFALPTFIYLLGYDLIDLRVPERTQIVIEVANKHGIPAVRELQTLVAKGATNDDLLKRYDVTLPAPSQAKLPEATKQNAVIAKGSTVNLDAPPRHTIDASTVLAVAPQAQLALAH